MDALAVIQARTSSTRLPGKVLADVGGEPLLSLLLRRLETVHTVDGVVVATSTDSSDDAVAELAAALGADVFRGSLTDVLGRVAAAAEQVAGVGPVVRITADCPLVSGSAIDDVVSAFFDVPGCEYASNIEPRSVPDGMDVEVISLRLLRHLAAEVPPGAGREHVTTAVRKHLDSYVTAGLPANPELAVLRWTVDVPADLEFVRRVVSRLGDQRYAAGIDDILRAVRQAPSLAQFGAAARG